MLRRQLFEFEDQSWFPETLRTPMTQNIVVMARWLGVPRVLAGLIKRGAQRSLGHNNPSSTSARAPGRHARRVQRAGSSPA